MLASQDATLLSTCLTHCIFPFACACCRVVHRCGEEILRAELPAKREAVLKLALTPAQDSVYKRYIEVGCHMRLAASAGASRMCLAASAAVWCKLCAERLLITAVGACRAPGSMAAWAFWAITTS